MSDKLNFTEYPFIVLYSCDGFGIIQCKTFQQAVAEKEKAHATYATMDVHIFEYVPLVIKDGREKGKI